MIANVQDFLPNEMPDWFLAGVLVLGIGREEAVELAERFGQRAIVFGKVGEPAELVDCLRF